MICDKERGKIYWMHKHLGMCSQIIKEWLVYIDCKKIKYENLIDKYKENTYNIKKIYWWHFIWQRRVKFFSLNGQS